MIVKGIPYLATHDPRNVRTMVSAVVSTIGIASGHLVVLSTIVSRYLNPRSDGKGPTTSTCTCENRSFSTGIGMTGGFVCLATLYCQRSFSGPMRQAVYRVVDLPTPSLRNQHPLSPVGRVANYSFLNPQEVYLFQLK